MNPRRTHESNFVFRLEGGTEDNDLWVHRGLDEDQIPVICSVWELTCGVCHPPIAIAAASVVRRGDDEFGELAIANAGGRIHRAESTEPVEA